ncbi:MAG: hypothetical protein R3F39_24525 [Myxococcota bacterium]
MGWPKSEVIYKAELVLETMIERMQDIVPFLLASSVESIETREKETLPDGRFAVRYWQGKPGQRAGGGAAVCDQGTSGLDRHGDSDASEFKVD